MISFIRTKICELYSVCKKDSLIGSQREVLFFALLKKIPLSGRQRNKEKRARFSEKFFSSIGRHWKQRFYTPHYYVAYFFAIWPTYFCWIYKLFSYPFTIRCLLFSWKITLKIESLQFIYLILLLMNWELFRQKLAIMRKIKIMGVVFKLPRVSIWDATGCSCSVQKVPSIGSQRKRLKNTPFR